MIHAKTVLLICGVLLATAMQAQDLVGNRFLEINPETVSAACGDADGTQWVNPFSVWLNPAGEAQQAAAFLHKTWIQEERILGFGYSLPLRHLDLTALLYTSSIEDILLQTGPDPQPEGTITAHDLVASVTMARQFWPRLRLGISGKYIVEKIYNETADGLAVDLGFQYELPWLSLSGAVSNLGKVSSLETERSELPRTVRLSAGSTLDLGTLDLRLMCSLAHVRDADVLVSLGSELTLKRTVSFRTGYIFGHDTRSYSIGAGFRLRQWRCDYGYIPLDKIGDTQQFTITYSF